MTTMGLEKNRLTTLASVVDAIDDVHWEVDWLYVADDPPEWAPSSAAAVMTLDPRGDVPDELVVEGAALRYALSGSEIEDVARNLRAQEVPTTERLIAALRFYDEFDSFIE